MIQTEVGGMKYQEIGRMLMNDDNKEASLRVGQTMRQNKIGPSNVKRTVKGTKIN